MGWLERFIIQILGKLGFWSVNQIWLGPLKARVAGMAPVSGIA